MSLLSKWFGRASAPATARRVAKSSPVSIESLEGRALLTAVPAQVATAFLDNRGTASFTFTRGLDAKTLTSTSAALYTVGTDGVLGTADDKRLKTTVKYVKGVLTLSASMKKNQAYRVILNATSIKDVNGKRLDGEFKGQGKVSGNGRAGGNFDIVTKAPKSVVYRFAVNWSGVTQYINVKMYTDTPLTVANFKSYADIGAWDTTFFHRSTRDATSNLQVIQGGGFNVNSQNQIGSVVQKTGIGLELKHSNVAYTLAMARTSDVNSNTNQWFFNVNDNTALDTIGGGYTVFGIASDKASQKVIASINALTIRQGDPTNPNSPFNELPSSDAKGAIDVPKDLVTVQRVAMLMEQVAVL